MPRPKKLLAPRQIHTLIEASQYKDLQRLAVEDKRPMAELVREAISNYLNWSEELEGRSDG